MIRTSIGSRPVAFYRCADHGLGGMTGMHLDDRASLAQNQLFAVLRPDEAFFNGATPAVNGGGPFAADACERSLNGVAGQASSLESRGRR